MWYQIKRIQLEVFRIWRLDTKTPSEAFYTWMKCKLKENPIFYFYFFSNNAHKKTTILQINFY